MTIEIYMDALHNIQQQSKNNNEIERVIQIQKSVDILINGILKLEGLEDYYSQCR